MSGMGPIMGTSLSTYHAPPESLALGRSDEWIHTSYQPLSYNVTKAVLKERYLALQGPWRLIVVHFPKTCTDIS